MADNFTTLDASDASITGAADEIGGVKFPRVKLIHGADGTNDGDVSSANGLPVDATGSGDVPITLDGETVTVDLGANNDVTVTGTVDLGATDNAVLDAIAADTGTIAGDTTSLDGKITACNTGAVVLAEGSASIGKLAANSGVDIGDVDVASCALPTGAATAAKQLPDGHSVALSATDKAVLDDIASKLGTIDADTGAIKTATEKIDDAISGTEMQVDVVASLPAGTNAIGKLVANSGVDIGDVDVTSTSIDKSINGAGAPTIDSYTNAAISASANTANQSLVAAPGASKQIWVYGINFTVGTGDGSASFQDEDDTAITGVMPFSQGSGMAISPSGNFAMPIWKVATNKALEVDTVTCDIKGSIQYAVVSV